MENNETGRSELHGIGKRERLMDYEKMVEMGEPLGIHDLMAIYEEYQKSIQTSTQYLRQMEPKFVFSNSDGTI